VQVLYHGRRRRGGELRETVQRPVAVKSGGHHACGISLVEDGLVIDLSAMKDVVFDPGSTTATVGPGCGWRDDLFWALRGAGGAGFGVVTRLRYRLDVVPKTVMGGALIWPLEHAAAALRACRDLYVGRDDDRLSLYLVLTTNPYPDGEKVVMVYGMYVGDPAEAESHLAPIRSAAKPLMDGFGPTSYYALQTMLAEEIPYGMQSKWYGGYFTDGGFDDDAFERIIDGFQRIPSVYAMARFDLLGGGAIARVPADATAFVHRDSLFYIPVVRGRPVPRLQQVKREYDPTDFFRHPQSIRLG
jgi:FAD binding domain/Berberine and berberine like